MKVIKPSAKIMDDLDLMPVPNRIELCGRVCYKSEGQITENSWKRFVTKIRDSGHNSVLEMAVVTLRVVVDDHAMIDEFWMIGAKYLIANEIEDNVLLVTGSVRAYRELLDGNMDDPVVYAMAAYLACSHPLLFEDKGIDPSGVGEQISVSKMPLADLSSQPSWIVQRHRFVAVRFIVNRAVSHELVRHRPCSFLQESQRYCRYDKEQFGGDVTFIEPTFYDDLTIERAQWHVAMQIAEKAYLQLVETSSPQAARTVLPNSCKTEIIVFANLEQWAHIFRLRVSTAADPSMREVMIPLLSEFRARWPECFGEWIG